MQPTILEMLSRPLFAGSRMVGGWGGLTRKIETVTVFEVPDAPDWTRGGEIVLSSGYWLHSNRHLMEEWISGLAEHGAVCLALKPYRFLGEIPAEAIRVADRVNLPLIALPTGPPWSRFIMDLTEVLHLVPEQPDRAVYHELAELIGAGKGFPSAAQLLADVTGNPIIVEDAEGRVVGIGLVAGAEGTASVVSLRVAENRWRPLEGPMMGNRDQPWSRSVTLGGVTFVEDRYPIWSGSSPRGWLCHLRLNRDEARAEHLSFWSAAMSACYDRLAAARERPSPSAHSALRHALRGEPLPEGTDEHLRRMLSSPGIVLAVESEGGRRANMVVLNRNSGTAETTDRLTAAVEGALHSINFTVAVTELDGAIAAVIQAPSVSALHSSVEPGLGRLRDEIARRCRDLNPVIGVSNPASDPAQYVRAWGQAQQALWSGLEMGGGLRHFRDLGAAGMVYDLIRAEGTVDTLKRLLESLEESDTRRSTRLVETVETFFAQNLDLNATAEALFVHINTVRYRLRQVEKLTGMRLDHMEDLMQLYMATQLKRRFTKAPDQELRKGASSGEDR